MTVYNNAAFQEEQGGVREQVVHPRVDGLIPKQCEIRSEGGGGDLNLWVPKMEKNATPQLQLPRPETASQDKNTFFVQKSMPTFD